MASLTRKDKDYLVELLSDKLTSLDLNDGVDNQQRQHQAKQLVKTLRVAEHLGHDQPEQTVVERLVDDHGIPVRPFQAANCQQVTRGLTVGQVAIVSDDEEDEEKEEEDHEELDFEFVRGHVYRSSAVRFGRAFVCVGSGYSKGQDGKMYYTSKKGVRYDMSKPPPFPCFNKRCKGQRHWRTDCPFASGNKTLG